MDLVRTGYAHIRPGILWGVCMMYGVSTEWVWTEGGWDDNIGLNRCRIDF